MNKNHKNILTFTILGCLFVSSVQAKKEDTAALTASGKTLAELSTTVETQGASIATMMNQMNEIVGRFQTMDGDIGRADRKNIDQEKVLKDAQVRLQTLEDKIAILTTQMQELRGEGMLKPASAQRFEEFKNFSKAVEGINSRNYTKAVTDLKAYQKANAKSPFQSYAQYWIGAAFYLQNDYQMAAAEFQKLLTKDPKSPKAPSALYGQGLAFYHLQSFDAAQEIFAKVMQTYPQSVEAAQASSKLTEIDDILTARKDESAVSGQ